jgi:glycosyltransferase involved in cell wall biosynthesis
LQRNDQFKKAICLIVGEGEEYSHVRAMIHQYHLESLIKILPAESDIEVLNTMADFCVITSLYEAGPYVLLEAASLGKPTIGTTVGFIPSFVGNNEAGICVIPGQPHQMADAIYSLLSDPKKTSALGEKAYRQFMNNYTYDRFIKNTIAVYEEVLRAH